MKILIVRTFPNILNLNAYNVQEIGLAKALAYKGIECGVVFYNGRNDDREECFTFTKDGREYGFTVYWLKGFGFFKNGFMPSVYKLRKKYDVIQVHEYDQIFSWMLYTRMKKPTVIYHGPYYHEYAKGYNLKCRVFDTLFLPWRKHDQVVALAKSELARDFLLTKGFSRVHTVGVGVDADNFSLQEEEMPACSIKEDRTKFRLLYVGKIEERRNIYFLVELFEKLLKKSDNIQLVIVGDGEPEYLRAFLNRIDPLIKKGQILYLQKATQKELAVIYKRVNLFVFTSNYEIFGMVLLEALYFGLPVISTSNGGASVLLKDGPAGYIMKEFDTDAWNEKITMLMKNTQLYQEMSLKAHDLIERHYLWDSLVDKFIEGYKEAIESWEREKKK
nr:glycosyltransferase family 4 protein [uncultured Eisenbergiella sp.]